MADKYRILSFDGSSVTGKTGWLSVGILRDLWYRSLKLQESRSPRTTPQHEMLNTWKNYRTHPRSGWYVKVSPLPAELGTMVFAASLTKGDMSSGSAGLLDTLKTIVRCKPIESRRDNNVNEKRMPWLTRLRNLKTLDDFATYLAMWPEHFLYWLWATNKKAPPGLRDAIKTARVQLHQLVRNGHLAPRLSFRDLVDLYAGTSAGGINSLIFAKNAHSLEAIEEAMRLWADLCGALGPAQSLSLFRTLPAFLGKCAFVPASLGRDIFLKYFGDLTLGDLEQNVLVTTVHIDSGIRNETPPLRRWKAVVYRNFQRDGERIMDGLADCMDDQFMGILACVDPKIRLVDIASHTSSLPIVQQIPPGNCIDGGFFANNPSMCAIAAAKDIKKQTLDNISLLSIGSGRRNIDYVDTSWTRDFGYVQWMLEPRHPMQLIKVMMDVGNDSVNAYCTSLLGDRHMYCNAWIEPSREQSPGSGNLETALDDILGMYRYHPWYMYVKTTCEVHPENDQRTAPDYWPPWWPGWLEVYWFDNATPTPEIAKAAPSAEP